jgi:hypothetical protein
MFQGGDAESRRSPHRSGRDSSLSRPARGGSFRPMRRPFALLALLTTTWSNGMAFPCWDSPTHAAEAAPAESPMHDHHASGPIGASAETDATDSRADGPGCGILMPCGAAVKGATAPVPQRLLTPRLDDAPIVSIGEPSAADLTQDPPPPRRPA